MLKKKVITFIWAALFAFGYYYLSVIVFNNVAYRSLIAATILNFALIIVFLIEDRVTDYIADKRKAKDQAKKANIFKRALESYLNSVSFKTALYLFYIYILICVAIDRIEPEHFSEAFSYYLLTVEYGILVLVASDAFLSQFLKDVNTR
jgi:hypothetical protein